jgi:hypothetical protein
MKLIGIAFGLVCGNFAAQLTLHQDWDSATERSYFQLLALACVWIVDKIRPS